MASEHVLVLTTFDTAFDLTTLASTLVEERLAACVNVLAAMESTYRWAGRIERASERQVVIKTSAARLDALTRRLKELHPYELPELLVVPVVAGEQNYLDWIDASTRDRESA